MNIKIDSIILYVQNISLLKHFYIENFNLEVIEEDSIWVLMNAGSVNIGLHKIGDQYLQKIKPGYQFDNNTKLVFEVDTDIESARNELLSRNVEMKAIKAFENYGFWLCDGTDPEGNVFQLKCRKQQTT